VAGSFLFVLTSYDDDDNSIIITFGKEGVFSYVRRRFARQIQLKSFFVFFQLFFEQVTHFFFSNKTSLKILS